MKVFTIQDTKAQTHSPLYCSLNSVTAMRELAIRIKNDALLSNYSEDFIFYQVGDWNQETADYTKEPKIQICLIADLIKELIDDDQGQGRET